MSSQQWYIDEDEQPFRIIKEKAAYIGRLTFLPSSYRRATSNQAKLFEEQNTRMWKLVEEHMDLPSYMADKFFAGNKELVETIGVQTLINAARSFDETKGFAFSTYACRALWRDYTKYKPWDTMEEVPDSFYIIKPELDNLDELQFIIDNLDEFDRSLLQMKYLYDMTFEEIGHVLEIGRSTVKYHCDKALERAYNVWSAS